MALIESVARAERAEARNAAAQFERTDARLTAADTEIAQERVLCDIDRFCDEVGHLAFGSPDQRDSADRMLRIDSRSDEADLDLLLAGLLLSLHRGDNETSLAIGKKLVARYLQAQDGYVGKLAEGAL